MKKEVNLRIALFLILLVLVLGSVTAHHKEGHAGGGDGGTTTTTTGGDTTTTGGGLRPITLVLENPKDGDTIKRGILTILAKAIRGYSFVSDVKITVESELFGNVKLVNNFGRISSDIFGTNVTIGNDIKKGEYAIIFRGQAAAYDEQRILITVDPTIYISTSLEKQEYSKGERIVFSGGLNYFNGQPVKNVEVGISITAEDFLFNKTIRTDSEGKFIDSHLISFAEPDGVWDIKIHATDEDGNKGAANLAITISTPEGVSFYTVTFLSPLKDGEYQRGASIPITVEVKDEGQPLENAIVDFKDPLGKIQTLEEIRPGTYSSDYQTSFNEPLGIWYTAVQALKTQEGITKAGGSRIPVSIKPATLTLTLLKPTTTDFSTGQKIPINAKLSYSDDTAVEKANVFLKIGKETIKLTESKPGIYTTSYLFTEKDSETQSIQLGASDIYGNAITLRPKPISVETIGKFEFQLRLFYHNVLLRFWYIILIAVIFLIVVTQPLWHWKRLNSSLNKTVEDEKRTFEMQKDTQRKYFKYHSLSRNDYDKLMLKYRERASDLKEKKLKIQKILEEKRE